MAWMKSVTRAAGFGMLGLGLLFSGCGSNDGGGSSSSSATFVDPGLDPGSNPVETELTKVTYQFGPGALQVGPNATFVDIALRDASGEIVQEQRFPIASSAQVSVASTDVAKITNTTVDVVLPSGALREHYEKAITLSQNQNTLVTSGTASTSTLSSIRVSTTSQQGRQSIAETGELQMVTNTAYELLIVGTYAAGTTTAQTIINAGTLISSNTSVAQVREDRLLVPAAGAASGSTANVNATFENRSATLRVRISGISAPSPTPTPVPSPSPVASPSPGSSPSQSPSPSSSPGLSIQFIQNNVQVTSIANGTTATINVNGPGGFQSGATFTASPSNLVTFSGNTVTAVSTGTVAITATVAAGTTTATLRITSP